MTVTVNDRLKARILVVIIPMVYEDIYSKTLRKGSSSVVQRLAYSPRKVETGVRIRIKAVFFFFFFFNTANNAFFVHCRFAIIE
jgi:hypothetical protein